MSRVNVDRLLQQYTLKKRPPAPLPQPRRAVVAKPIRRTYEIDKRTIRRPRAAHQ